MSSAYNNGALAEKLSKLNNSQQSIESLSSWCITHQKKAKYIVETWEKLFSSSSEEKKVSFLYLANDILQNSRRKGSEFVNEFWRVLPGALKSVHDTSEDHGKVVLRLVGIWDQRKVFGSRGQRLKDDILGQKPPQQLDNNGNNSNPIKVVRKDAETIRFRRPIGEMPEKLVTAYQNILDEHFNEDIALNKCKSAVLLIGKMEKECDDACSHGNLQQLPSIEVLQEQESTLKQCIVQFGSIEATRATLAVQLKEALEAQEAKLELIRSQIQVAQTEAEHASNLRQKLVSTIVTANNSRPNPNFPYPTITNALPMETTPWTEPYLPTETWSEPLLHPLQRATLFTTASTSSEEQQKKAAAAAMAARLAASTSSAQMLTSVLSSLAAEEAASKNSILSAGTVTGGPSIFPPEKRPKLEKPTPAADLGNTYFGHFPPLPLVPPPQMQHFVQASGGSGPYGFSGNRLPPPPPLPPSISMGSTRPCDPASQQPPLPPMPPPQQQWTAPGYQPQE